VERGERTKLDEIKFHELRLAQGQLIQDGARLFGGCNIHEENRAFLILTNPPLVDLASQIQPNRIRHNGKKRLELKAAYRLVVEDNANQLVITANSPQILEHHLSAYLKNIPSRQKLDGKDWLQS
jgi:hypothetical protein